MSAKINNFNSKNKSFYYWHENKRGNSSAVFL